MSRKTLTRSRVTACGVAATLMLGVSGATATSAFAADATVTGTTVSGKNLVVAGTNLKDATLVLVGNTPIKVNKKTPPTDTAITVPVPASLKGGSYSVGVVTPDGIFAAKDMYGAKPVVSKFMDEAGLKAVKQANEDGTTKVTILGTGFTGLKTLTFGKASYTVAATDIKSDTKVALTIPKKDAADLYVKGNNGAFEVKGENKYGVSAKAAKLSYFGVPALAETQTGLGSVTTSKTTSATIKGTNLAGAAVTVGGLKAKVTATTATSVTFVAPAGAAAAKVDVVVTTKEGKATGTGAWEYTAPPAA